MLEKNTIFLPFLQHKTRKASWIKTSFVKNEKTTSRRLQRNKKKTKNLLFYCNCLFGDDLKQWITSFHHSKIFQNLTRPSESSKIVFLLSVPVVNHFVVRNFKFVGGSTEISLTSELQIYKNENLRLVSFGEIFWFTVVVAPAFKTIPRGNLNSYNCVPTFRFNTQPFKATSWFELLINLTYFGCGLSSSMILIPSSNWFANDVRSIESWRARFRPEGVRVVVVVLLLAERPLPEILSLEKTKNNDQLFVVVYRSSSDSSNFL